MILIVPALFFRGPALEWRQALGDSGGARGRPSSRSRARHAATYYAGLWDRALSFHLYTGRQQHLIVLLPAQRTLGLVPEVRRQFVDSPQARGFRELNVDHWSDRELRVPLVSEVRILRRFMERWCATGVPEGELIFVLHHPCCGTGPPGGPPAGSCGRACEVSPRADPLGGTHPLSASRARRRLQQPREQIPPRCPGLPAEPDFPRGATPACLEWTQRRRSSFRVSSTEPARSR